MRFMVPAFMVAAVLAVVPVLFAERMVGPSDSTVVVLSDQLPGPALRVSAVLDPASGLRSGDVVVSIDRVPIDRVDHLHLPHFGDLVAYGVLREGHLIQVPVRLGHWPAREWMRDNWSAVALAISLLAVTVQVFRRRPTDPAARTLLAMGTLGTVGVLTFTLGGQVLDLATGQDLVGSAVGEACHAALWGTWLLFVLLFPQPIRCLSTAKSTVLCAAVVVTAYIGYILLAVPSAQTSTVGQWRAIAVSLVPGYLFPPLILLGAIVRFWLTRGTPTNRYLAWVLGSFAVSGVLYCFLWQLPVAIHGTPHVSWNLLPLAFLPFPLAFGGVVLRYGLFDIKTVAGRSLVYVALTFSVVAGYVTIVAVLGSLVTTGPLLTPPLLATVILAVLAQPVKDRLQRTVSRLLYGSRDEPYRTLSHLGQQLEATAATSEVLPTVADTVARALRTPYAAVELCASNGTVLRRAETGSPRPVSYLQLPAVVAGQFVGRLLVTPRPPATTFGDSELRLLTDLARQAAPALQALRLTVELQHSRERLLRARAEERRRLQRDLHDGIGPSLAGLVMQAGAARALLDAGATGRVSAALTEIENQLKECATHLRQLLLALRFPLLDSLGFVGALRYQMKRFDGHKGLHVSLNVPPDLPTLPAAVEEAALAIVSEAITNVVRHADAKHCTVTIKIKMSDILDVVVVDDGCGISSSHTTGIGLNSMRQRATDLRGSFRIHPLAGGGTEVSATLPLTAP